MDANKQFQTADFKIVLLGPAAVGKTSITNRYINNQFSEFYDPSVKQAYYKKFQITNHQQKQEEGVVELLDTGGQEDFQAVYDDWIRQGDSFLVVYSLDNDYTLNETEQILKKIQIINEKSKVIPALLVGNKSDLPRHEDVTEEKLKQIKEQFKIELIETSAKFNTNIQKCLEMALRLALRKKNKEKNIQNQIQQDSNKSCCEKLFSMCNLL